MGIGLGLVAALAWGTSDFLARETGRRLGSFRSLFGMQIVGLALLTLWLGPAGLLTPERLWRPAVLEAAGGSVLTLLGALLFYRALAIGRISIVSPVAAAFAAVTAGLAILAGDRPSPAGWAGIVLTLAGVVLAATAPGYGAPTGLPPWRAPGLAEAALAALLFGAGFWVFARPTPELGGPTVVWIGRLVAAALLVPAAPLLRQSLRIGPGRHWLLLLGMGALDSLANGAYAVGVSGDEPAVVAVLGSLFSAVTVLLAFVLLKERPARWQWLGVWLILAGVALVSLPG